MHRSVASYLVAERKGGFAPAVDTIKTQPLIYRMNDYFVSFPTWNRHPRGGNTVYFADCQLPKFAARRFRSPNDDLIEEKCPSYAYVRNQIDSSYTFTSLITIDNTLPSLPSRFPSYPLLPLASPPSHESPPESEVGEVVYRGLDGVEAGRNCTCGW